MPLDGATTATDLRDTRTFPKPKTAEEAVRNGATLLDIREPGWRSRIRLDELHLPSPRHCVLGQAFEEEALGREPFEPGYFVGVAKLGISRSERHAGEFGFAEFRKDISYEALHAAWLQELA